MNIELRKHLARELRGLMKPRVLSSEQLEAIIKKHQPNMSHPYFYKVINELSALGEVVKLQNKIYINKMATPSVNANELASYLVPGAVISFHKALEACGAMNNYSNLVTAYYPVKVYGWNSGKVTDIKTDFGNFWIVRLPDHIANLNGQRPEHQLVAHLPYAIATPEKALCDWIYVANQEIIPIGIGNGPPLDLDLSVINLKRTKEIAREMNISEHLFDYLEAYKQCNSSESTKNNKSNDLGF